MNPFTFKIQGEPNMIFLSQIRTANPYIKVVPRVYWTTEEQNVLHALGQGEKDNLLDAFRQFIKFYFFETEITISMELFSILLLFHLCLNYPLTLWISYQL